MSAPRTILITGGARGVGRATAILAGRRGWSVAIGYRADSAAAEQTAQDVRAAGGRAMIHQGDVARESDVIALFDAAEAAFGPLHGVVVDAGIIGRRAKLADMDAARIEQMLRVNLFGAILTAREAARRLRRAENTLSAALVFVSSGAARLGSPDEFVDYAATKGALDTLTIGLSKELAPDNIRVNAVRLGLMDTAIHAQSGEAGRAARIAAGVPLRRAGRPEEAAEAILWLLSDAASYTTGALLDVTGGR